MTPAIRAAGVADVTAVLAFWAEAAENADRPADDGAVVQALLARDPGVLLLAVDGDRIVGSVIAGWDGWRSHLYRLAVHPVARRAGVASRLLDAAEARLRGLGARRFDAMVLAGNDQAHAFWAARGYARQAEWGRWVRPAD